MLFGIAFGWFLERGGMGNARKLAGQFYFTDLSVLKLMFSAIVTAMLGLFWLSWAGLLDLSRVYVPETFIAPQLVGGLVFGVGFAIGGLCPGTSCVAAATGRQGRSRAHRRDVGRRLRVRRSVPGDRHVRGQHGSWRMDTAAGARALVRNGGRHHCGSGVRRVRGGGMVGATRRAPCPADRSDAV